METRGFPWWGGVDQEIVVNVTSMSESLRPIFTRRSCLTAILAAGGVTLLGGAAAGPRLPTVDDFLALEDIGLTRPSPNGRWIAVEVARSRSLPAQRAEDRGFDTRCDIWLIATATGDARRLTEGVVTGWSYWAPIWSPDSMHIAILTTEGGRGSRAAVLNSTTNALQIHGDRRVAQAVNLGSPGPGGPIGRVWATWRGPDELITALLPDDESNWEDVAADPLGQYGPLWKKTEKGAKSVTIWDSRHPVACGVGTSLVSIGTRRPFTITELATGSMRAVSLSRTGRFVALVEALRPRLAIPGQRDAQELGYNGYNSDMVVETQLSIYDLEANRSLGVVLGVSDLGFSDVRRHPQWNMTDDSLSVPSFTLAREDRVFRIGVPSLNVEVFPARSPLDAELIAALLARASPSSDGVARIADRIDLSRQKASGGSFLSVPGSVLSFTGQDLAVVVDDTIVSVDGNGRPRSRLQLQGAGLVYGLDSTRATGAAVFRSEKGFFVVESDGASMRIEPVTQPEPGAVVQGLVPGSRFLMWAGEVNQETRLFLSDRQSGRSATVLRRNSFAANIAQATVRPFHYRLPTGEAALAAMLLPPNYDPARPYPVVITGYPTYVVHEKGLELQGRFSIPGRLHQTLLCAEGYVVIVASMPVPPGSMAFDPLQHVADQADGLAEQLIDRKVAARGRVGFIGHSYGGYAALAVAARCKRFNAVVASSPFADLIMYHDLPFVWFERETCAPNRARFHVTELEAPDAALLRMGGAPDEDLEKYLRNSPRFQMGKRAPPVLMIAGEFDAAGFRHVDGVYAALERYGVPVKVARYWGEGHNLGSPGNIQDAWEEIRDWFKQYLSAID